MIEIVAFAQVQLLDVSGPLQVFATANDIVAQSGGAPPYALRVVAQGGPDVIASAGLRITADRLPSVGSPLDTLIIAGGDGVRTAAADRALVNWIRGRAEHARRVASVCTGAFLLAATGLLDGRRAATHWSLCAELARSFPAVRVEPDPIFVHDGSIWTSAGVTVGIDLAPSNGSGWKLQGNCCWSRGCQSSGFRSAAASARKRRCAAASCACCKLLHKTTAPGFAHDPGHRSTSIYGARHGSCSDDERRRVGYLDTMDNSPLILLAAGGTGGHLFPAEALGVELIRRGLRVRLATDARALRYGGLFSREMIDVVPSETVRGRAPWSLAYTGVMLAAGTAVSLNLMRRLKPAAVVGFGGYPTLPPLLAARLSGVPGIVHEANA